MYVYCYEKNKNHNSKMTDEFIKKSLCDCHYTQKNTDVEVYRTEHGKPYVDIDGVYIGITHTDSIILVGVSDCNFGIDAECADRCAKRYRLIAKKWYTENEKKYVLDRNLLESVQRKRFIEIWVKKEAYLKWLGTGLSDISNVDTENTGGHYYSLDLENMTAYVYSEKEIIDIKKITSKQK